MPATSLQLTQSQKLSQSLQVALRLLSGDLDDLAAYMREAVQENPALELVPPQQSAPEALVRIRIGSAGGAMRETARPESPLEALEQQLRLMPLPAPVLQAALSILRSLNPRGYFIQPLRDFSEETGIPYDTAKQALHAVQSLEPVGVGARDIAECLTLQLAVRKDADPLCETIVRGYLMELASRSYDQIAKETGVPLSRIQRCAELIRSLSPAPVSLSEEPVQYILPEFCVEADASGGLTAVFSSAYYPALRQDAEFLRIAEEGTEGAAYARQLLFSANQVIRAVDLRQSTMERIARLILDRQRGFFLSGCALLPLSCRQAAEDLGVSESTVYRALQNKYLYCARGTFPLSHFFQSEISGGVSRNHVRELIAELCGSGDRMSDREIAEALASRGITISRRTVAKYRQQQRIDSSYRRETAGK